MPSLLDVLRPSHGIPLTRWRARTQWRGRPLSVFLLMMGLWLFGTGEALLINAGIGVSPWTVFAQGVSVRTGLAIGFATALTSTAVLALWIPLRQKPGLGTVSNIVVVAAGLEVMMFVVPIPHAFAGQLLQCVIAVAIIGLGSGFYLTAGMGPGPRDGWMTGLHNRFGWPVWVIRFGIEIAVLVIGWFLGGTVGLGTLIFALFVGPFVGYGLRFCGWIGGAHAVLPDDEHPEFEA